MLIIKIFDYFVKESSVLYINVVRGFPCALPMSNIFGSLFTHPDQPTADSSSNNPTNGSVAPGAPAVPVSADISGTIAQANKDSAVVGAAIDPAKEQGKNALSHMDPRASQVLVHAYEEAKRVKHSFIETEQLFLALVSDRVYRLSLSFYLWLFSCQAA